MTTIVATTTSQTSTWEQAAKAVDSMLSPWEWDREAHDWGIEWSTRTPAGLGIVRLDDTYLHVIGAGDASPGYVPLCNVPTRSLLLAHLTYMLAEIKAPEPEVAR